MEKENKKRGREEDKKKQAQKSAKKQDHSQNRNICINSDGNHPQDDSDSCDSWDDNLGLGVFDFPWLHEGTISKSEDWTFEDSFSSSLDNTSIVAGAEFPGQCLSETPAAAPLYFHHDRFEESIVWPLKGDDGMELEAFDCIWSSLLKQPL